MQYGCAAFAAVSNAVVQCNRLRVVMGGGGRKTGSATHTHTYSCTRGTTTLSGKQQQCAQARAEEQEER